VFDDCRWIRGKEELDGLWHPVFTQERTRLGALDFGVLRVVGVEEVEFLFAQLVGISYTKLYIDEIDFEVFGGFDSNKEG
jgi:hypothetical protein